MFTVWATCAFRRCDAKVVVNRKYLANEGFEATVVGDYNSLESI